MEWFFLLRITFLLHFKFHRVQHRSTIPVFYLFSRWLCFWKHLFFFLLLHAFIYSSSNKSQQCVVTFSQFYPIQSVGILRKKKIIHNCRKKKKQIQTNYSRVSCFSLGFRKFLFVMILTSAKEERKKFEKCNNYLRKMQIAIECFFLFSFFFQLHQTIFQLCQIGKYNGDLRSWLLLIAYSKLHETQTSTTHCVRSMWIDVVNAEWASICV